jgi:steroid 5-alpha reductase family enzyme
MIQMSPRRVVRHDECNLSGHDHGRLSAERAAVPDHAASSLVHHGNTGKVWAKMILLILVQGVGLSLAMAAAWKFQQQVGNAGWVDVFWTFATGAMAVVGAVWPLSGAEDLLARRYLVATLAAVWAIRLGLHLRTRVRHRPEDARYAGFRRDWGARFQTRLFWFLQIQAIAAWPLVVAIMLAARNPAPGPRATDFVATVVIAIALIGEMVSDRQLAHFAADAGNAGQVCDRGLWSWSRHPNYFFEFLGWCAWPLFAFNAEWPLGWLALAAPVMMYWLLVHVSGIPPLEQVMLASRGDAYRAYQGRTSAFLPLPPRSEAGA